MLQRRFAWCCIEVCEVSWRGVDGHVGMYDCGWRGMWDAMLGAVQDDNRIHDILRRKRESMRVGAAWNGIGNVIVGVIRCGTEAEARSTESEAPRSETGEQEAEDQPYGGPRMDRQYT